MVKKQLTLRLLPAFSVLGCFFFLSFAASNSENAKEQGELFPAILAT